MSEKKKPNSILHKSYHSHTRSEFKLPTFGIPIDVVQKSRKKYQSPHSSFATSAEFTPRKLLHKKTECFSSVAHNSNVREQLLDNEMEILHVKNTSLKQNIQNSCLTIELERKDAIIVNLTQNLAQKDSKIKGLLAEIEVLKENSLSRSPVNMPNLKKDHEELLTFFKNTEITLNRQIEDLKTENSKSKQKCQEMLKMIVSYKKEIQILKNLKIYNTTTCPVPSDTEFFQTVLLEENQLLKEQLKSFYSYEDGLFNVKISDLNNDLYKVMLDLTQLLKISKAIFKNEQVDIRFLLGMTQIRQDLSGDHLEKCKIMTNNIKNDMLEMRDLVSDLYAEKCGEICTI